MGDPYVRVADHDAPVAPTTAQVRRPWRATVASGLVVLAGLTALATAAYLPTEHADGSWNHFLSYVSPLTHQQWDELRAGSALPLMLLGLASIVLGILTFSGSRRATWWMVPLVVLSLPPAALFVSLYAITIASHGLAILVTSYTVLLATGGAILVLDTGSRTWMAARRAARHLPTTDD